MFESAKNIREPTTIPSTRVVVTNTAVRLAQRFWRSDEKPAFLAAKAPFDAVIEAQTKSTTDPGMTQ